MHQITMAVLVLLWLITDIHVAIGTCMACAISGTATSRMFHVTRWKASIHPGYRVLPASSITKWMPKTNSIGTYMGRIAGSYHNRK